MSSVDEESSDSEGERRLKEVHEKPEKPEKPVPEEKASRLDAEEKAAARSAAKAVREADKAAKEADRHSDEDPEDEGTRRLNANANSTEEHAEGAENAHGWNIN